MEREKYAKPQKKEINISNKNSNYTKTSPSQKNDLELKRFNSQEVYLVNQKKPQNITSTKQNKKIYINLSKENQDKINPKIRNSFNNNSNGKISNTGKMVIKTENIILNNTKTKITISPKSNVNSIKKVQNIIKTSKILDEESIQEIESEYDNNNSNKDKKYKQNNLIEKKTTLNSKNRIIKKINFDDVPNNNNELILNSLNDKDDAKNRELLLISKKGDKEKLYDLLSLNQIDINFQNENGWSALHFACDEGNLKISKILIKSKIDLNLKTNEKKTALHISTFRGYFDITKLLIESGAKINLRDNEQNLPVHICASQGFDEILNFILEKNSTGLKIKNLYGKTPLDLATKESTREIINKYLNIKKNKNENISPLKSKNSKNQFSRIKIRKTNKNLMKCLMTPISPRALNNNNLNINNISNTEPNNSLPKTTSKKFNTNKGNISINTSNKEIKTSSTLTNSLTRPYNTNPNVIKNSNGEKKKKENTSSKKIFTIINKDTKQNKPNKLKIEISSSNKTSHINRKNILNKNCALNETNNTNTNDEFKNSMNNNNPNYLNTVSNKHKTIFNLHISCNNNGNKSPSPYRDLNMHYNTSSNKPSSSKKLNILNNSNNNNIINKTNSEYNKGNEIFFGEEKEKVKGKIINIPKKIKSKKEDRSQSKKNKISSVWKTVTQTERIVPKFSPNVKYAQKSKIKNAVFKKEDSKIMNTTNLSSKRTVSVPRFLDTEYILEPQKKNTQFKREESAKNKFKVPKKNKGMNNSNQNMKNKNRENIKNFKGKVITNNSTLNKNKKQENLGIKTNQIYTEEGANLIDDLEEEEEQIIELPKKTKTKDTQIKHNKSKELKNPKINNLGINTVNNAINISINLPSQNLKKNQNIVTENDEDDDIEELEDSFYSSDDSDSNKNDKIGPSNFICLALLGQGSFGEVYLVKKKDSEDFYAMKVLDKCRIAKQNIFKYVLTERNVLSVMHNPFIVKLNYAFQTSEKLFLLLDYCPGGDLSKQLQIQTRFSEEKAKFYICEIILALGELHKHNIIFRDLKPDNVVIDKEGHALLTDFGLSREGVVGKEIAKSFCGSIAYLAPEMLNRTGHGKAVDWYLLGVLFYELLVGVPPYFTRNQEQIFRNIQNAELYIPPFMSEKATNLIKSLLKRNPNERLGSKRDVEEIKEHEYFADVDWEKVYERKYKPPQIYLKSNHLQFFRQPVQFKENEDDDLFVQDNNNDYNKYNQDILNSVNKYKGWSFVQKKSSEMNKENKEKIENANNNS